MDVARLLGIVYGALGLVISLSMGLNIQTANEAVQSANLTNLIGMEVLDDWGAALIILGLLTLSGTFLYGGVQGTYTSSGVKDLIWIVGAAIGAVIGLTLMTNIITAANNLIGAVTTDAEDVVWGFIPLAAYAAIIGGAGWKAGRTIYKMRKSGKKTASAAASGGY
jgi:hypothetical protein